MVNRSFDELAHVVTTVAGIPDQEFLELKTKTGISTIKTWLIFDMRI